MHRRLLEALAEISRTLDEVETLSFPSDCDQRELLRVAKRNAVVKHGGNHDTVIDPESGKVVTQLPRHDPKPGTCRAIIKALKAAFLNRKKE